jgi:hypothetical protein
VYSDGVGVVRSKLDVPSLSMLFLGTVRGGHRMNADIMEIITYPLLVAAKVTANSFHCVVHAKAPSCACTD